MVEYDTVLQNLMHSSLESTWNPISIIFDLLHARILEKLYNVMITAKVKMAEFLLLMIKQKC